MGSTTRRLGSIGFTLLVVGIGGCSSSAPMEEAKDVGLVEATPEAEPKAPARRGFGEDGEEALDADSDADLDALDDETAADPYAQRAGAEEGADESASAPAVVRFVMPTGKPLPASARPRVPSKARLAVALIRDGVVTHDPEPILRLDTLLDAEADVAGVFALGAPRSAEVDVAGLARQAKREGRDLLLLDVSPGPDGARVGLLVSAATGALLARYEEQGQSGAPAAAGSQGGDLCERLGHAFSQLKERRP